MPLWATLLSVSGAHDVSSDMTVGARFRTIVDQRPDACALIDGERRISFCELSDLAIACGEFLRERLTLSPGDVVLAWLDNCVEFAASLLAVADIGAALMPVNVAWRPAEVGRLLDRMPVAGVLTRRRLRSGWDALADRVPTARVVAIDDLPLLERAGAPWKRCARRTAPGRRGARPAAILVSSGSTGEPKVVARSHRLTVEGAAATASALGVGSGSVFLSAVPFHHGNGLDNSLMLPLLSGATAVLLPVFSPSAFLKVIQQHRVDACVASPAIFDLLNRHASGLEALAVLRVCASSGGPLAPQVAREILTRTGVTVRQVYGSSETGVIAVGPAEGRSFLMAVPGVTVKVVDRSGRSLPPGVEGEIAVRRRGIARGYLCPGGGSSAFKGGFFHTGDRGSLDSSGGITLLGRLRPAINLGGTKVDPVEVENAILSLAGVGACRVLAAEASDTSSVVKAVVAVEEGVTLTRADVIRHCRDLLAEYKIPRLVELVPALPRDLTGKRAVPWASE